MGTDPLVARYGARWRIAERGRRWGCSPDWIELARDRIGPSLDAARVLGTMPNIVANRLNSQYDLVGPSFTVSAEERSGLVALELASRALRAGEIDAALVGAVDLSCEHVHAAARRAVMPGCGAPPGDAAVALVLKRLDDAERDGDTVYAVVAAGRFDEEGQRLADRPDLSWDVDGGAHDLSALFGHAHAAAALVHVAAAAVVLHHRLAPGEVPLIASNPGTGTGLAVGLGPRTASVSVAAMDGVAACSVLLAEASGHPAPSRTEAPRLRVFSGDTTSDVLAALAAGDESADGPARLVIVADDDRQFVARAARARRHLDDGHPAGEGVHFHAAPVGGEMAFVFTGAGAAVGGMGASLLRAVPELIDRVSAAFPLRDLAGWIVDPLHEPTPSDYLWGTALVTQAHAHLTRHLLGLRPTAAIGYSSGESNSLFAFGVWRDMDALRRHIETSRMMEHELGTTFAAVARAWGVPQVQWAMWNVLASIAEVRAAVEHEPRVHVAIINTRQDVVIGGDADACERVVDSIGRRRCVALGYNLACHVPELAAGFHEPWLRAHTRPVTPMPGVRFYSNGVGGSYDVSEAACADAITRQAEHTLDFPATIEAAFADGVRVFVEHGPGGACTSAIRDILREHDIVAVQLDRRDKSLAQVFEAMAALVAAGVDVDHTALTERLARRDPGPVEVGGPLLTIAAHPVPFDLPPRAAPVRYEPWVAPMANGVQTMVGPPRRPPVLAGPTPTPSTPPTSLTHTVSTSSPRGDDVLTVWAGGAGQADDLVALIEHQMASLATMHQGFVEQQAAVHRQFLAVRLQTIDALTNLPRAWSEDRTSETEAFEAIEAIEAFEAIEVREATGVPSDVVTEAGAALPPAVTSGVALAPGRPGPRWDKAQLAIHSSGRISELFGPAFAAQDPYAVQCRMPEPPLLLADRVTGLDAEPCVLGRGTIWTETDVVQGAWYLNAGRMPTGFMIESGQADLMLISWMGIDLIARGTRSYRLLGCTLTYHGDLPAPGETLAYEIRITGHARHGDIRMFFFEYDCTVDGVPRLTVRDAQAGFFDRHELADALGVLWTPEVGRADLSDDARVDPPAVVCTKRSFTRDEVVAYSDGRVLECFGPGFELTETHTRTPRIQSGPQLFIDEVVEFDPAGGPWGRGFMRCETAIADDAWFFAGHFKNDPCMPGNFMVEACVEAMSLYLTALGHTIDRDGWRFQPLPEQPFELKCRGEINPQTERVAYELYVEEVWAGPLPTLVCDVVGFVDGKPGFHAHRLGVQLVPDWPLTSMPEELEHTAAPVPVAADAAGLRFDRQAMLACAWGRPSNAFGAMYEVFDGTRRAPRLPGEPYHFVSRITKIDGELGECRAGMIIEAQYDVPADAWYFDDNGSDTMPFAVLMEVALQPCGWVGAAVGSALAMDDDVLFRNLDGTATVLAEVRRDAGTLTTRVELTRVSKAGGMIIEHFDVECTVGGVAVFTMQTVFGFFPPAAFASQAGLAVGATDRTLVDLRSGTMVDLTLRPGRFFDGHARLPGERLLMIDRAMHVVGAGAADLGVVRGEKDVDAADWFFKAHFFQDPVQPGSLGVDGMLQLLQFFMIDAGMTDSGDGRPLRFEPVLLDAPISWTYRGQVTPHHVLVTTVVEITAVGADDRGPFALGTGSLWCDGLRIHEVRDIGMRLVRDPDPAASSAGTTALTVSVELGSHPQLVDHAIDGVPVVPVVFALEWFARAAAAHVPSMLVAGVSDLRVLKGLVVGDGRLDLAVVVRAVDVSADGTGLALELIDTSTGRAHYRCVARMIAAPQRVIAPTSIVDVGPERSAWTGVVYGDGVLFHGPSFHAIRRVDGVSSTGITATLHGVIDLDWPTDSWITDPVMLDGVLQLAVLWTDRVLGGPSLPTSIDTVSMVRPPSSGPHIATVVERSRTSTKVVCDATVHDSSGTLVAEVSGIATHVRPSQVR